MTASGQSNLVLTLCLITRSRDPHHWPSPPLASVTMLLPLQLAATFEASVADGSVDSDPDNDDSVSILEVADSAELERISIAAASEFGPPSPLPPSKPSPALSGARLAVKIAAKHRPAQDSASEIQPDTSPESTYREPSLRKQQTPGITAAKAALMQLSADLPKPTAKATAAWQNPRAAARRKTAMDAWWASEARQDFILRTSESPAPSPAVVCASATSHFMYCTFRRR